MRAETENVSHVQTATTSLALKVRRVLYLSAATLFFVLGSAGVILPGLPATPFLLLTSFFLVRSSPRLNDRLLRTKLLGPILRDWQQRGGLRAHVKVEAVMFVLLAVGLTLYFSEMPVAAKCTVTVLAAVGIVVIVRLPIARN